MTLSRREPRPTLLVFTQVYVPDPASVGQHMADACAEMARRGWRVVVYAAARGYDDPTRRYPSRDVIDGVEIRRLPLSSFGKRSIGWRVTAGVLFVAQCIARGVWTRNLRALFISTSPPMTGIAALVVAALRGGTPIKYWVMDINPDQAIRLGQVREGSMPARSLEALNRAILRRAAGVVTLDRFMAARLRAKDESIAQKLSVIPPWPHESHLETVDHARNPFREQHGLEGKFVIMYSGNHGPSHPLTTALQAALQLREDSDLVFLFVGGGLGKREVEETIRGHGATHIRSLPYEPLDRIKYSLSAADVHLVSVGDAAVGVVHPCKVYGAMAVARPVLLLGPDRCHVADILSEHDIGWRIRHGDVQGAVETIRRIRRLPPATLREMGRRAAEVVRTEFAQEALCGRFCDILEDGVRRR